MFQISRVKLEDLGAVRTLFKDIAPELINKFDIALQARDQEGALVGFIWAGLMAKSRLALIDHLHVAKHLKNKQIGDQLLKSLLVELKKRKVRQIIGYLPNNENLGPLTVTVLRSGMGGIPILYTKVYKELR